MNKFVFIVCVMCCAFGATNARADLTFSQWARGPSEGLGVYAEVLGFLDRWKLCLSSQKLSFSAIGEGVVLYAKANPIMESQPAAAVILAFINDRCGLVQKR